MAVSESASPLDSEEFGSLRVRVAYAVLPSELIWPAPWLLYGLTTLVTCPSFSIALIADSTDFSTEDARTVPESTCHTSVALSPV